ncbi:nucleoprotein TPR-like isoform X2 [Oncorhynchus masou masou]|uniref:nucleoprotein TPR-like isoform X2 n=1 Tax=Oncorhynchus masou masou TaxID=90313 RepID=UPI0031834BF9
MLNEQNVKLQEHLSEVPFQKAKFPTQLGFASKRYKMLQENLNGYRREIAELHKKSQKMAATAQKHEQNIHTMTQDLWAAYEKLTVSEQSRLNQEKGAMMAEQCNQNLLLTNLKSIQCTETETRQCLNSQIERLERELPQFKKKPAEEVEQRHVLGRNQEAQLLEAKKQLEAQWSLYQKTKELLKNAELQANLLRQQLSHTEKQNWGQNQGLQGQCSGRGLGQGQTSSRVPIRVSLGAPVTGSSSTIAKSQSQPIPVLMRGGQVLLESLIESKEGKSQEQILEIIRFVRREKEVAETQFEVATLRYKQRVEHQDRALKELQESLNAERGTTTALLFCVRTPTLLSPVSLSGRARRRTRSCTLRGRPTSNASSSSLRWPETETRQCLNSQIERLERELPQFKKKPAEEAQLLEAKKQLEAQWSLYQKTKELLKNAELQANLLRQQLSHTEKQNWGQNQGLQGQCSGRGLGQGQTSSRVPIRVSLGAPVTGSSSTIAKSQSQPIPVLMRGGQVLLESLIESKEGKSQEQILEIIRFVRREKEVAETQFEVATLRYKQRVEHQDRALKELQESLNAERNNYSSAVLRSHTNSPLPCFPLWEGQEENKKLHSEREAHLKRIQQLSEMARR